MKLCKFIDPEINYLFYRKPSGIVTEDFELYQKFQGKKYSIITNILPNNINGKQSQDIFFERIQQHLSVADHVCVIFNNTGFYYQGIDGDEYKTVNDFTNQFYNIKNITFFGDCVFLTGDNKKIHFINKMIWPTMFNKYSKNSAGLDQLRFRKGNKKHWDCLLGVKTIWKDKFENLLINHRIFDKTIYSYFRDDPSKGIWNNSGIPQKHTAETFDHFSTRYSEIIDRDIYNDSYYSVVFETWCHPAVASFSEKLAKPIIAGRPFVLFASPNGLQAVKELGFKTFDCVIDESYDKVYDHNDRMSAMLDAMAELSTLDPEKVYEKCQSVIAHNKNHFFNHNWRKVLDNYVYA